MGAPQYRKNSCRRIRRRQRFVEQAFAIVAPEFFLPYEAIEILFGPLPVAKRALRRAARRQSVIAPSEHLLPRAIQNRPEFPQAPRPVRVLSRLNRSGIFPPLVPSEIHLKALSVHELLTTLRLRYRESAPHHLLDALATASGLLWENCAEILLGHQLITNPIDPIEIAAARDARSFWIQYEQGRARYSALVTANQIPEFVGDWAHFEDTELVRLLPGMIIPTRLKREHYLTNWLAGANHFTLDVYGASTFAPLFQHQFPDRLNPLRFGKCGSAG